MDTAIENTPPEHIRAKHLRSKSNVEPAMARLAFEIFCENGLSLRETYEQVRGEEGSPSYVRICNWSRKFDWHRRAQERAILLDREMAEKAKKRREKMIESHFELGDIMLQRSKEYFLQNDISKANDAVAAATAGVKIQREAEGMPDHLIEITRLSEEEIIRRFEAATRTLASARVAGVEAGVDLPRLGPGPADGSGDEAEGDATVDAEFIPEGIPDGDVESGGTGDDLSG